MSGARVIVVGGGLAGLSAAHTVLERGGRVIVLDKNPFLGGNSTKATSGINGALTKTQIKLGIPDSAEKFYDDTAASAKDLIRPPLVKVLTYNSASAVEWLQERFGLDLSLVSRLGGHSFPRTHRGKEKFPGMTITYALMEKLEELAKSESHRVQIIKKAKVVRLLQDESGVVQGVEYERDGKIYQEAGVVVLATGGYAADFAENGLIKQIRPDLFHLPTTNGDHSTGDGIKMVRAIGGNAIDLEKVQVHPTGLVDPNEPDAKVKFLAAEALRGVGGLLLTNEGLRFCDELGRRDYVTGEMWKFNKPPYRLVLNSAAAKEIEWHCKHYMGRNLMKFYKNGAALAADMGISIDVLNKTFTAYNQAAQTKNDPFGKQYFHNLPFDVNDEFYVSIVTPVVHYCMGGLEIGPDGEVRGQKGQIQGLFAAGEVCGGVHGANRLGGSSLLGCVVYGRVSGDSAAKYLFDGLSKGGAVDLSSGGVATKRIAALATQLPLGTGVKITDNEFKLGATITQPNVQTRVEIEPNSKKFQMEIVWNDAISGSSPIPSALAGPSSPAIATSSPSASSPAGSTPSSAGVDRNREYTADEVAKHNTEKDCWVIVNGQVLDVTDFLKDHPGGKKAILIYAGRDASAEFNMLHKPDVVEKYAPNSIIGKIKGGSGSSHGAQSTASSKATLSPSNTESAVSGGTSDILPSERARATFPIEKLTNYLDGGVEGTKRRRFILTPTKDLDASGKYNLNPHELLKHHVQHFLNVHEPFWDTFKPTRDDIIWMMENANFSGSLMNHYGLFLPTLEVHCSDEQKEWWATKARRFEIAGAYAQTELGHGSNVRGLQTIAEFDKNTQEFVLNTPTLQSMKWWPGTLGKVATHALVYAQLIIDGKEYGVHSFMVQIRDENHKPLAGIELGDLGPKLGDHANDTGYMKMQNVRIPREFMLSRYQQVSSDGKYIRSESKQKNAKLHYTTMIFTRGSMVRSAGGFLARAVTIATRYSCVRRQGYVDTKKGSTYKSAERQIIDYQVQRFRIFRQIALAYAIKFTGAWMLNRFKDLEAGDHKLKNLEILPEIAATSGGLKALCTFLVSEGIEDCRKCCGGNGYLMASGLAPLAANYVWQTTAEGDWIILMLQTGQFLLKSLKTAVSGQSLSDVVSYLAPLKEGFDPSSNTSVPTATSVEEVVNLEFLEKLFRHCALVTVANVGNNFQRKLAEVDGKFDEAFNANALDICNAVRAHCFNFILHNFVKAANKADSAVKAVLSKLCALYACSNILDEPVWNGLLSVSQVQVIKAATTYLLDQLRPDAVALVDAFDFPDRVLNSAIGGYDGNVYETLYESALRAPLNQRDPFDGYKEYLQPHLSLEFLKNHNKVPSKSPNKL